MKKLPPPKLSKRKAETDDDGTCAVRKPKPSKRMVRTKLPAIRDKEPEQHEKEEEGVPGERAGEGEAMNSKPAEDDAVAEFLGEDDVPSPPDSEDLLEPANSEELEQFMQDSDEDDDIFEGDFAVEKKRKAEEEKAKAIPTKAKMYLDKLDKDLVSCIPKDLSEPPCCMYIVAAFVF